MFRTAFFAATILATTACTAEQGFDPDLDGRSKDVEVDEHSSALLAGGGIFVTEVMRNPDAVSDRNGEWFELYNATGDELDLNGLEVRDSRGTGFVVDRRVRIPAYGYAVLARSADPAVNGGIDVVDFAWSGNFSLANAGDDIHLIYADDTEDVVTFDSTAPVGAAEQLSEAWNRNSSNGNSEHWCPSVQAFGDGDKGTPGTTNHDCGDTVLSVIDLWGGEVVITEIMRNPDATTDARGEWFELHNTTDTRIDLWDVKIHDSAGHSFTFPLETYLEPHSYFVVGQSADLTINGGVEVDFAWPGSLTLGNGTDDLFIDAWGWEVDSVAWDSSWDAPVGASLILRDTSDPLMDNDEAANWCVASDAYGAGDFGTPGQSGGC